MDFYGIFKLLHVLTAIAWVGGGATLLCAGLIALRTKDDNTLFGTLGVMNILGKTWFIPASLATVVLGAIATTLGGAWGEFWVILGLAGFAATFCTGTFLIEPTGLKIGAALGRGETVVAKAAGARLLTVVKFDYTVMFIVVADMVLKPGWTDLVTIVVFAAIITAAGWAFLRPVLMQKPAVA